MNSSALVRPSESPKCAKKREKSFALSCRINSIDRMGNRPPLFRQAPSQPITSSATSLDFSNVVRERRELLVWLTLAKEREILTALLLQKIKLSEPSCGIAQRHYEWYTCQILMLIEKLIFFRNNFPVSYIFINCLFS